MRRAERSLELGAVIVGLLVVVGLAAPLLAPHPAHEQLDSAAGAERPPGTVLAMVVLADGRTLLADRVERTAVGISILRLGETREIPASEVANLTAEGVSGRCLYLLGTDRYGRDLLSRLLAGTRVSLLVALSAVLLALTVGLAVGAAAALGGPLLDAVLMRTVDALLSFPTLFLLLTLSALFRPELWLLIVTLGATAWMGFSRLVRGELLKARELRFIEAARGLGLPWWRILGRHLLPTVLAPLLATASLMVGNLMLAESALSFLGLGVTPPAASWGSILNDGRENLLSAWWVATLPGLAIAVAVTGFNLLGDGLRDRLDPRPMDPPSC